MSELQSVIVSGGSRGLGLSFVKQCLEKGVKVATCARKLTNEINDLQQRYPDRLFFQEVDITDSNAQKKFVNSVASAFGEISALVNNAAVGQDHLLTHLPEEKIHQIITTNLTSQILMTKLVVKKMLLGGNKGRIINISSICGVRGYPGLSVYSATKGAMDAFTRSLARELGNRGILVNSIAPGFFSSEMSQVLTEEQMQIIKRRTATEELTTPEQILPVLEMLLFTDNNISGQVLYVDGGAGI
ncbi:short-chain dehydrogenase/reductase SDR [Chloroherpeton thalassium ATCC 35110]|uniref:Short-chain dehydrogenase/reductase SDR n=1 Tax=Chloroherpeton thalassium (strain ATCC 35110 / GB-78) TaxID=517418 RepID=B3QU42_CHLT3|nr:SDR family oxidoreductase [Chloroherpeton thalassium]ACF12840.1 short-chain dehydrogenase/reductase SDR [Chloroherpeton thalassium ATCC 35110]